MLQLGEKIKSLRKQKNISQEVFANYLGVSFQAVSKWENGNTMPDVTMIPAIASFFGVSTDELFDFNRLEAEKQVEAICRRIAASYGGSVDFDWRMSTGPVYNHPAIADKVKAAMEGLEVIPFPARMSSEDFAWYLTKAPGVLFRYGSGNEEIGIVDIAHNSNFQVDEVGMKTAIYTFVRFALQYEN